MINPPIFVIFFCTFYLTSATNVLRPRGVSLQNAAFYDPSKSFNCFDGSAQISFQLINDDYCDCKDGSDEPGTSACVNGTFYCNNIGHTPQEISSSLVNDGVCDCCDASDEWASNADCLNNCEEIGAVARKEAEALKLEQMKGYNIRQQMVEQGQQIRKEKQVKLSQLKIENEQAEALRLEKLDAKEKAEIPEKEALEKYKEIRELLESKKEEERKLQENDLATNAFTDLDADQNGLLTITEIQSRTTFDTNRDGEVSEEEAKFYLSQGESMTLDDFLETGWPLIKQPYQYGKSMFTPPEPITEEPLHNIEADEEIPLDDKDEEELLESEEYAEEVEDEQIEKAKEVAELEETIEYDENTQMLVDAAQRARDQYDEQEKLCRQISEEIEEIQKNLERDFGPNDEFRPLFGSCSEFSDREYIYKLCPFDYAVQKPKSGSGETRLGSWGQWSGTGNSLYSAMKYSGGQQCWNGPQRSVEVELTCGTETILNSVSEPNRCEYLFMMVTPAACVSPNEEDSLHRHIEL